MGHTKTGGRPDLAQGPWFAVPWSRCWTGRWVCLVEGGWHVAFWAQRSCSQVSVLSGIYEAMTSAEIRDAYDLPKAESSCGEDEGAGLQGKHSSV